MNGMNYDQELAKINNSIEELIDQKKRIQDMKAADEYHGNLEKMAELVKHKEGLLAFVPHTRKSCSDENPCNRFYSKDHSCGCPRCGILELIRQFEEDGTADYEINLDVYFRHLERPKSK